MEGWDRAGHDRKGSYGLSDSQVSPSTMLLRMMGSEMLPSPKKRSLI